MQNMRRGSIPKPNLKNYLKKLYHELPNYDSPKPILATADITSSFLGVRPRSSEYRHRVEKRSINQSDKITLLTIPDKYTSDILGASELLHSLPSRWWWQPIA